MNNSYCLPQHIRIPELALLYGVMLGDGCLSKGRKAYTLSISGHHKDDVAFFEKIQPIISAIREKQTKFYLKRKQGKVEFNFSDKKLFLFLSELGFPIGKKGQNIHIPKVFDQQLLKFIMQGYFATDGSVVLTNNNEVLYPRLEMKSISEHLLKELKQFLQTLGLNGHIYSFKPRNGQLIYRLQLNGKTNLNLFNNKVGFFNPKHKLRFEKIKNAAGGL